MRGDLSSHLRPVNSLLLCGTKRKLLSLTGFPIDSCSTLICSPRCIGTVFSKCNYDFDTPLPKAHQLCHICMSCSCLFAQTHHAALWPCGPFTDPSEPSQPLHALYLNLSSATTSRKLSSDPPYLLRRSAVPFLHLLQSVTHLFL